MSTDRNPFPDEAAHLIQMNEKLEEALKKAEEAGSGVPGCQEIYGGLPGRNRPP